MDFIERLLGISPDGGSGATEAMIVVVPLAFVALLACRALGRATRHTPHRPR